MSSQSLSIHKLLDSANLQHLVAKAFEYHGSGDINQSETLCHAILAHNQDDFNTLHLLGVIRWQQNQFVESLGYVEKALSIRPNNSEALKNRQIIKSQLIQSLINSARALHKQHKFVEASALYEMVLLYEQEHAVAIQLLGTLTLQQGKHQIALDLLDSALIIDPNNANAHHDRGYALAELGRHDEAVASYKAALGIDPNDGNAYHNLGNTLKRLGRLDEALASFDQALAISPDNAHVLANRANTLYRLKRLDEAMASYEKALAINPHDAVTNFNLSFLQLSMGDFETGWRTHEWRWKKDDYCKANLRHTSTPLWQGSESLSGKTILLWSEQGLGDTIQFCRFATDIARRGAKVILEVPGPLIPALRNLVGVDKICACGDPLPPLDFQISLLSLPLALNLKLPDISGAAYLSRQTHKPWIDQLSLPMASIGIVWSGRAEYDDDSIRSIPLSLFNECLPEGLSIVCLQKEIRDSDRQVLSACPNIQVAQSYLHDFGDTAALIQALDLVVTVDTGVAHLAGAMGKDVWILLPYVSDWRWMLDRVDTPWYDSATLFRQPQLGDWCSVLEEVRKRLVERFLPT